MSSSDSHYPGYGLVADMFQIRHLRIRMPRELKVFVEDCTNLIYNLASDDEQ
jgi:hypothetical protein